MFHAAVTISSSSREGREEHFKLQTEPHLYFDVNSCSTIYECGLNLACKIINTHACLLTPSLDKKPSGLDLVCQSGHTVALEIFTPVPITACDLHTAQDAIWCMSHFCLCPSDSMVRINSPNMLPD